MSRVYQKQKLHIKSTNCRCIYFVVRCLGFPICVLLVKVMWC